MPVSKKKKKAKSVKKVKKPVRSRPRKAKAKKTAGKKKPVRASKPKASKKPKILGRVTHYYDRIGVAVVELKAPLKAGDMIRIKRGIHEVIQRVTSLQIDHATVMKATKGEAVGLKVEAPVRSGSLVSPA